MTMFIVILGLVLAITLYHDLDKVLATTGVLFGTFVVLLVPSLCHYKLLATNPVHGNIKQQRIDLFIMAYSVIMAVGVLFFQVMGRHGGGH